MHTPPEAPVHPHHVRAHAIALWQRCHRTEGQSAGAWGDTNLQEPCPLAIHWGHMARTGLEEQGTGSPVLRDPWQSRVPIF